MKFDYTRLYTYVYIYTFLWFVRGTEDDIRINELTLIHRSSKWKDRSATAHNRKIVSESGRWNLRKIQAAHFAYTFRLNFQSKNHGLAPLERFQICVMRSRIEERKGFEEGKEGIPHRWLYNVFPGEHTLPPPTFPTNVSLFFNQTFRIAIVS